MPNTLRPLSQALPPEACSFLEGLPYPATGGLHDAERIAAVHATGLIDTPVDPVFDRCAGLARRVLHADAALVALLDAQRVVILSAVTAKPTDAFGSVPRELPLADSLCPYTVAVGVPVVCGDVRNDPRFMGRRALDRLPLVAYAAAPLVDAQGRVLGTLSVVAATPREWGKDDVATLTDLAAAVMAQIDSRAEVRRLERSQNWLRSRQDELHLAMKAARLATFEWDIATQHVAWSDNLEDMLGMQPGAFRGTFDAFMAQVHAEDRQRVQAELQRALLPGSADYVCRFRMHRPDGSVRWTDTRGQVQRDDTGAPLRLIGVDVDITQRMEDQAALQVHQERMRLAAQVSGLGFYDFDLQRDTLQWSPQIFLIAGVDPGTPLTLSMAIGLVHADDRDRVASTLQQAMDPRYTGEFNQEFRIIRQGSGETRWVHNRGLMVFEFIEGRRIPVRGTGVVLDISARKLAEAGHAQEHAVLKAVLAKAPIGFALFDRDLHFQMVNERLADINGLPVPAHLGKTMADIVPSLETKARSTVDQVLATGQPVLNQEFSGTTAAAAGVVRHWSASWYPVFASEGTLLAIAVLVDEITERKQAEQRLHLSARLFQALVLNSPFGVYVVDAELRLVEISRGAQSVLASGQPALGRDLADVLRTLWAEPFASEAIARFRHTLRTGEPYASQTSLEQRAVTGETPAYEWYLERVGLPDGRPGVACHFFDLSERLNLLAAVQQSNARLRAIQDNSVDGFMLLEPVRDSGGAITDFRWLQVNQAAADIVGHPRDWFTGRLLLQEMPGNRSAGLFEGYVRVIETATPWSIELDYPHDGLDKYLRLVAVYAGGDLGVSFADMTEKRRIEVQVRQSEDRLSIALEAARAGAFDWNVESGQIYWSDGHYTPLGLRPGEAAPSYELWRRHVHHDDIERVEAALQEAIASRTRYSCEYRTRGADGAERFVHGQGLIVERPGHARRMVGAIVDITDLKQADSAARASERRFRLLAESVPAPLWVCNAQAEVEYANREYCDFFGVDLKRLQDGWQLLLHPEDAERYIGDFTRAMEQRAPFRSRTRARHVSGEWRWIDSTGVPRFADDGAYLGHVGLSSDISAVVAATEALHHSARRKDLFLATLSHELRNPLAPIRSAASLLDSTSLSPDRLQWAQHIIQRQVSQMARLLDDLLDVSRINQRKVQLQRERLLLSTVIEMAVETARPAIDRKGHELVLKLPADEIAIDADAVRLSQVLINLLNNAAKYTDAGGCIRLSAAVEDGLLVLRVRDNGVGIEPAAIGLIFNMFSQVEDTLNRSEGGLGVGLALVKGLVELHGGTVEATSRGLRHGSEFVVRLPVLALSTSLEKSPRPDAAGPVPMPMPMPMPMPLPVPVPVPVPAGHRVLVADDNRDSADTLAMMLELDGYEVRTAYSGPEALSTARSFAPAVALLDIGMPEMDGYQVARSLRSEPGGRSLFLIALTGWGQEADKEAASLAGFDQHLTKPVDPDRLVRLLAEAPLLARGWTYGAGAGATVK